MKEKNLINERIIIIINNYNITPLEFSKRIGLKYPDKIYNVLAGKTGVSTEMLCQIKKAFPKLSMEWVFTGNAPMFHDPHSIDTDALLNGDEYKEQLAAKDQEIMALLKEVNELLREVNRLKSKE